MLPLRAAIELSSSSYPTGSGSTANDADVYRWFARFLLEGKIIPSSILTSSNGSSGGGGGLKEPPSTMTSTRPSIRAAALLAVLRKHEVSSKQSLAALLRSKQGQGQGQEKVEIGLVRDEVAAFLKADGRKQWRADFRRFQRELSA